ncbi:pleckstrin homology domain-containing family A member 8 isoform X2 [Mobula birostris]|uniref:pleckstrin homology domain-containing family A member 8 isoform X2 n=1 Tax=Mobula birostris TaxID=1983395 RepID=UPI003B27E01B
MEGMLYKWTNYLSGWQPRWFVLAGGVLSYYDSQEDTWKGCKGSIKMAVCEIQVHAGDSTRVELIIPGEQHFYLKAVSVAERQRWLVALGSSKACLTDSRTRKEKEINENTECLKKKVSELRLYCDLLLHQVNNLKENRPSDQSSSTNLEIKQRPPSYSWRERNELKNCQNGLVIKENKAKSQKRSQSEDDHRHQGTWRGSVENVEVMMDNSELPVAAAEDSGANIELQPSASAEGTGKDSEEPGGTNSIPDEEQESIQTFFSAMDQRFNDIEFEEDNGIPTLPFLESCYAIVPVLDKLGPTVFAPVKLDFVGNIKKINQKYITDTTKFTTLQKIVLHELETEVATVRNSATEALLWLKRGLKFLKGFLEEVNNGEKDIQKALNASYGRTLRQYHGWVVRGVFALALRAAPLYEAFMAALAINEGDEQKEAFYEGMQRDLNQYLPAMGKQIEILDALYEEYNLESDEVV